MSDKLTTETSAAGATGCCTYYVSGTVQSPLHMLTDLISTTTL